MSEGSEGHAGLGAGNPASDELPALQAVDAANEAPGLASPLQQELSHGAREARVVMGNAIKLSLSLTGTLIVALVVRALIPRYLGPENSGKINFADAYAAGFFVFSGFGVDSYIRKEVSTRLGHVNDFWAGFWLLRLLSTALIAGAMAYFLTKANKGSVEWRLVFIYAAGQVAFVQNTTVSALLHAASRVNELSLMNVISKLMWGGGIWLGLVLGWPIEVVAWWFLISEGVKAIYLALVTRNKLNLRWNVDMTATWAVLVASFPYFLNTMCHSTYARLNVIMLSFMANDKEVGWYGAAAGLAGMSMFFLPVMQAVIVPLAARTVKKKGVEAMNEIMRWAVRLIVVVGTLPALLSILHADSLVRYSIGAAYGESALSLAVLGLMFPLTYLATLGAMHLIQLDRIWTMTKVSLAALAVNPLLNGPLIYAGYHMGPGWAGAMSALASICTEAANAIITFSILGAAAIDRRLWRTLGMTVVVCGVTALVHVGLQSFGLWLVPLECALYLGLAVATGALPLADLRATLKNAQAARSGADGQTGD